MARAKKNMNSLETVILPLRSPLHDSERGLQAVENLLQACRHEFPCRVLEDNAAEKFDLLVIAVMTGGTENSFLQIWPKMRQTGRPVLLAATRTDNSLPAALEILSWLKANEPDTDVAIVHGTNELIAAGIKEKLEIFSIDVALASMTAGVIGQSSEWLIASSPDTSILEKKLGTRFEHISMPQFKAYVDKAEATALSDFARTFYRSGDRSNTSELARAAKIYGGLMKAVKAHQLQALTLRCFDILQTDQTTGCLALAKLNDEGITAGCEGDVPTMLTMIILRLVSGRAAFMANPSNIDGNLVTFAHCTCPISILGSYSLNTHFESGIGLAVAGGFTADVFTVCRFDFVNNRYALGVGRAVPHVFSAELCRTQLRLDLPGAARYFLGAALGNHHVLVPGDHSDRLRRWSEHKRLQPVWE